MSGSFSQSANFVNDAFASIAKTIYKPEYTQLGVYTYLPWVRQGFSAIVQAPASGELRAKVSVEVDIEDDEGRSVPVAKTLTLRGPSDVLGIEKSQVIKRYPAPDTSDAEEGFLAHIEFDRPELPWLYTPFPAAGAQQERLDPWMTLVVLESKHAAFSSAPSGFPVRVKTIKGELQPLSNAWAFAHAQVIGDTGSDPSVSIRPDGSFGLGSDLATPSLKDRLGEGYAPVNLARLLCPRRLEDGKNYVACLVPTYDCGVKTGLNLPGGTLNKAWIRTLGDDAQEITLPVYDHWRFRTAKGGAFEELSRKLKPILAPWEVGRRFIDAAHPKGDLPNLDPQAPGRVQVLKCAIFSPNIAPPNSPDDNAEWEAADRHALRARINRPDEQTLNSDLATDDLPRIGPRIYGRFHRGASRVDGISDFDWFQQLNTTPVHRIVAGLGTRVVQKDQEALMQSAWAQVGGIDRANRRLHLLQFARYLSTSIHSKHLAKISFSGLAQITQNVHGKLKIQGDDLTLAAAINKSFTAPAALKWSFRRATQPRGALGQFAKDFALQAPLGQVADEAGLIDSRRPYSEPDGVRGISPETLSTISNEVLGEVLKVSHNRARATFETRQATLRNEATLSDQLLAPVNTWQVPRGHINPGKIGAEKLVGRIRPIIEAVEGRDPDLIQTESLGGLVAGLATSGIPGLKRLSKPILDRVNDVLPDLNVGPRGNDVRIINPRRRRLGPLLPGGLAASSPLSNRPQFRRAFDANLGRRRDLLAGFGSQDSSALSNALKSSAQISLRSLSLQLAEAVQDLGIKTLPAPRQRQGLAISKSTLLAQVEPAVTFTSLIEGLLKRIPAWLPPDWFSDRQVRPIMAAPKFDRPMFEALDAYDRDWLVPGLGKIAKSNFVTLLESNPAFIEAFFLGLSDEMGRELLWRGYPTDQRGTYFKRFWEDDRDDLAGPIHRFGPTRLGNHLALGNKPFVVFVVRGELVKRYPDAIMMALQQGNSDDQTPIFKAPNPSASSDESIASDLGRVLFQAHLSPDIMLVGFNLTKEEVEAGKWWFFIAENPTAPRFGLDAADQDAPAAIEARNDLDWDDVQLSNDQFILTGGNSFQISETRSDPPPDSVAWPPSSSSVVARVLLQNAIRVAYKGANLINSIDSDEGA
ncbi:MAG: hypothetical protein V3W41_16250 [Planctomycetota bacterium]